MTSTEFFTEPRHNFVRNAVTGAAALLANTGKHVEVERTEFGSEVYVTSHRITITVEAALDLIEVKVTFQTAELLQYYVIDRAPYEVLVALIATIVQSLA